MQQTVTITRVERLGFSVVGNPYYRLHLEDGTSLRTRVNGSINVGIENSENLNTPVVVEITKAGRVWNIKAVEVQA